MCSERKATGEYVLACFMFAIMAPVINTLHVLITLARGEPQFRLYSGPSRFVSSAYHLYSLRKESQIWFVVASWDG